MARAGIILAAGKGTRMRSDAPKVLHEVCGSPMLGYAIDACQVPELDDLLVVVGYAKQQVMDRYAERKLAFVEQTEQRGTGHAVMCCHEALKDFNGSVLVLAGDMPLVRRDTLAELIAAREESGDALTLATTELDDPTGYGRIVRDASGELMGIVEHRNCTREQLEIREVNVSYYCFEAAAMFEALQRVEPDPLKGEYYLPDAVQVLRDMGRGVSAPVHVQPEDAMGVNSQVDLAIVGRAMEDRIQAAHMNDGVTLIDPDNTWIEAGAHIGAGTSVYPFSFVGANATIGEGCTIGPFAHVHAGESIPDNATVQLDGSPMRGSAENAGSEGSAAKPVYEA